MKLKYIGNHEVYYAGLGPNEDVETWWPDEIAARLETGAWVEVQDFDEVPADTESAPATDPEPAPASVPVEPAPEPTPAPVENPAPALAEHE